MTETAPQHRERTGLSRAGNQDRLPPHASEAEQGVLGCILVDTAAALACVKEAQGYFQGKRVFYESHHRLIFEALESLAAEDSAIDLITVAKRLKERDRLEEVGGVAYLMELPNKVPSATNLTYYLKIVWGQFLARELLGATTDTAVQIFQADGLSDQIISGIKARVELIETAAQRHGNAMPKRLKRMADYEQAYWDVWFGKDAGEPGFLLPPCFSEFPFKVRKGEQTFLIAEKGAGKSTLASYIRIHLLQQGMKACVASMEMRPEITIKIAAAQLLGARHLPDNAWGHKQAIAAFDWLRDRLLIYDFLGIADWREILHVFEHAAGLGSDFFEIDSVMRLGIMDDDYAQQGLAAASFAQFAVARNVHLLIVNHLNKSDRSVKQRSRGSQQWIDNSHNVCSVHRNEEKQAFIDQMKEELKYGQISQEEFDEKVKEKQDKYDAYFDLHNQRWQGSRQNGRRYLYFNADSLQLHERPFSESVNWHASWGPKEKEETNG